MLEKLTMKDFSKHLNHTFQIKFKVGETEATPGAIDAELVEVSQLGEKRKGEDQRQSFSVVFRGPNEPVLPQQVYSTEHDGLGPLDLFLVPIGPDKEGMLYEAIFS